MSDSKKSNFKNLLDSIDQLNTLETHELYVPSLGRNIPFSPLTVKQQKQLLSSGVDMEVENLAFSNTLNDVIQSNCKQDIQLLVSDRTLIALQLRSKCVGKNLNVAESDEKTHAIDLDQHVQKCINQHQPLESQFTVTVDGVVISCEHPTLKLDTSYNKQFTKSVKKQTGDKDIKLTDIVGDIYVYELIKYIKSISINDASLEFDKNVSTTQKVEVFESLPMRVSTVLAETIKTARDFETKCIESDLLPTDVTISIDASLFTSAE